MDESVVTSRGARMTEALGACLAAGLEPGDRVFLRGDLGGGKTTFARGIVRGLLHPEPREVASPTFALHHRYEGGRLPVDHLDLYRLDGGPQLALQGVLDPLADPSAVTLIEWPDRLPCVPEGLVLEMDFQQAGDEDERRIRLRFVGPGGRRLADAWDAAAWRTRAS